MQPDFLLSGPGEQRTILLPNTYCEHGRATRLDCLDRSYFHEEILLEVFGSGWFLVDRLRSCDNLENWAAESTCVGQVCQIGTFDAACWLAEHSYLIPPQLLKDTRPLALPPCESRNDVQADPWPECPVKLQGLGKPVVVLGKPVSPLDDSEYAAIEALVRAGPVGLTKAELGRAIDLKDGRGPLRRLVEKHPQGELWRKVIAFPGKPGGTKSRGSKYRLIPGHEPVHPAHLQNLHTHH